MFLKDRCHNSLFLHSRAILTYLSSRYGKDDSLYPKDVVTRAKIDGLLFFDCSTLTVKWRLVVVSDGETDRYGLGADRYRQIRGGTDRQIGMGDR